MIILIIKLFSTNHPRHVAIFIEIISYNSCDPDAKRLLQLMLSFSLFYILDFSSKLLIADHSLAIVYIICLT